VDIVIGASQLGACCLRFRHATSALARSRDGRAAGDIAHRGDDDHVHSFCRLALDRDF
jgi:hypothetical protein